MQIAIEPLWGLNIQISLKERQKAERILQFLLNQQTTGQGRKQVLDAMNKLKRMVEVHSPLDT